MLQVGTRAPYFFAQSHDGRIVSSTALLGSRYVLYFFRRAFTRNCTVETTGFRDNYEDLRARKIEVVGVSGDEPEVQCRFARDLAVQFPIIPDAKLEIAQRFDVAWRALGLVSRVTYCVDEEGIIRASFRHQFQATRHLDDVLRFAETW